MVVGRSHARGEDQGHICHICVINMSYICHICKYTYKVEYLGEGGVQLKLNYSGQAMVVVKCFSNVAVC